MTLRTFISIFLLGTNALFSAPPFPWEGEAAITFSGTSTLHGWAGGVAAKPFITNLIYSEDGRPSRIQGEVMVESGKMDTAEPKRDENMHQAMKSSDYPLIRAVIDAPWSSVAGNEGKPERLPLSLTLLGKEQKVEATVSNWKLTGKKATFDLDFDVSLKASGIQVPSVLLVIRVGDAVKVHASVTLTQP